MGSFLNKVKEFAGLDTEPEDADDDLKKLLATSNANISIADEDELNNSSFSSKVSEDEEEKINTSISTAKSGETAQANYIPVIRKPVSYDDCQKIAMDIKENKMVTVNLEELDHETARDLMDFLSGAMSITKAKFVKINNTVYAIIPEGMKIQAEEKSGEASEGSLVNIQE